MDDASKDLADRYEREAQTFEMLAQHYARLSAHCEQIADVWRHAAPGWAVAQGGPPSPDRNGFAHYHPKNNPIPNFSEMTPSPNGCGSTPTTLGESSQLAL